MVKSKVDRPKHLKDLRVRVMPAKNTMNSNFIAATEAKLDKFDKEVEEDAVAAITRLIETCMAELLESALVKMESNNSVYVRPSLL